MYNAYDHLRKYLVEQCESETIEVNNDLMTIRTIAKMPVGIDCLWVSVIVTEE